MNISEKNHSISLSRDGQADLMAMFHHRLLSLEFELKERARYEKNPKETAKRLKRLRLLQDQVRVFQNNPSKMTGKDSLSTDLGLPSLSACGPEESALCDAYLQHRQKELKSLEGMLRKVAQWVEDAASGRSGILRSILRLAKLRKYLGVVDSMLIRYDDEQRQTDEHCTHLLTSLDANVQATQIDGLSKLFESLDRTITRVAGLRAKVRRAEQDVAQKEAWLSQQEQTARHYRPSYAIPEPTTLWKLCKETSVRNRLGPITRRTKKVEQFWQEMLSEHEHTPRHSKPSRKDLTLGGR